MFNREFKINLKSLLLWILILSATYILVFSIYPSLMNEETTKSLEIMINSMPNELLSTFNMDIVGIEDAYGWFKTEGYMFLTIIGGLYSAILGSTILIKEESDKTIEFLYSKPISRNNIINSKILCGIVNILIFTSVVTIINYIFLSINLQLDIIQFLMISLIPLLLYFLLFFICLFISTFMKKSKKSMTVGIAIVFISYFMQIIGGMGEKVKIIKDISLFEFSSSRYIIVNNELNTNYIVIGLVIILLSIIGIYINYNKKELM